MKITDHISYGKANAISNSDLAIELGMKVRDARRLVHQARVNGEPICSTLNGVKQYLKGGEDNE